MSGSPGIRATFDTSYAATAGVVLLVPMLVALVLDPLVFLAADRWPRPWFVRGGLLAMALAAFAAALAPGPVTLSLAIALSLVGGTASTGLGQATLVDLNPHGRERILARWTLLGLIGDLTGPALLALIAWMGLGWRAGFATVGVLLAAWGLAALQPFPAPPTDPQAEKDGDGDAKPGLLAALKVALGNRRLMLWLGVSVLCDLLDEILVVFASLHLRDKLNAGPTVRAVVLGAFAVGGLIGVLVTERLLLRQAPLRLLTWLGGLCAASYLAWMAAPNWWLSALGMLLVGTTAAPLYPITIAQAYAALPGRSGTVNAAGHVFAPVTLALPWLLGLLADRAGTQAALLVLVLEPIGIGIVAALVARRRPG
jgi:MFS family permease